jgi:hypothetical protein
MKCEDCLPLVEEYSDGELSEREAARVESHVVTCEACAQELETLSREQEIYARYRRDVQVTPAQWNIVRARIEQEKDAEGLALAPPRTRLAEWLGGIFGSGTLFRPAFIAALVLLAVGVTAGLMYLSYRNGNSDVASHVEERNRIVTANPDVTTPKTVQPNENSETVARDDVQQRKNPVQRIPNAKNNRGRDFAVDKRALLARLPRSVYRRPAPGVPIGAASVEEMAVRKSDPLSGDFDFDISRHSERAQMLLRSFRNAQTENSNHATDISYEKENARKLLYQNIALRRSAEGRRDEPARELLDALEPILLDIANLPDRARARDVRSIEQRMEKKEIVAALQVRRLLASN